MGEWFRPALTAGQPIFGSHLPHCPNSALLTRLTEAARPVLPRHPVNERLIATGKHPANAIWLWGAGVGHATENHSSRLTSACFKTFLRAAKKGAFKAKLS
ncbi:MAG: hypothetical protein NTY37_04800 [Methanothrix sp.]|nr:hypothetical protein [Methanothrix sp.]